MVNIVNLPWAKELAATDSLKELTAADKLAALSFKRLDHARRCEFVGRSTGFLPPGWLQMAALLTAARMATSATRMYVRAEV